MRRSAPIIIVFNGAGSSGKSSTARALQEIASVPLLHFKMDGFLDMLPDKLFNHPDGLTFAPGEADGHKVVTIDVGVVCQKLLTGMRHAVKAMAECGNSLIVDDVVLRNERKEYMEILKDFDLRFVRFNAPLGILEDREKQRGDREIGLARGQFETIRRGDGYDLEVDTSTETPAQVAQRIRDAFFL